MLRLGWQLQWVISMRLVGLLLRPGNLGAAPSAGAISDTFFAGSISLVLRRPLLVSPCSLRPLTRSSNTTFGYSWRRSFRTHICCWRRLSACLFGSSFHACCQQRWHWVQGRCWRLLMPFGGTYPDTRPNGRRFLNCEHTVLPSSCSSVDLDYPGSEREEHSLNRAVRSSLSPDIQSTIYLPINDAR